MSTQLILYPQNHKGYSSSFSGASLQFLVDGINFNTINTSASITNSGTVADIIIAQPPIIVNTWYRARQDAAIAYPTENNSNLELNAVSTGKYVSTVYQRLDNLTVGQIYTVTVNFASNTSGLGIATVINGTTLAGIPGGTLFGANITQTTFNFTAATIQDIFVLSWSDNSNYNLIISNIGVTASVIVPTGVYTELFDGQVICDLYQEEDIPLTLSIDDFKNVAEQVQSYSKDFNLPATKRNNQIFNNMFEVTRADDGLIFNPYVKTKCVLKEDGFILFEGYLRLIDVKDKEGEISYNVNLYSEVIALADVLKDATFSELDFSELEHDYNKTQIKYSWNDSGTGITYINASTSGFRDAYSTLKYPFIDWNHQYIIAAPGGAPTAGNPQLPSLETAFRPCIQLKYLIERIFAASGFNFTSDFFDSADFGKLYMDFNWGSNEYGTPIAGGSYGQHSEPDVFSTTSFAALPLSQVSFDSAMGWDSVNSRFVATYNYQTYLLEVPHFAPVFLSSQTMETRWAQYNSAGVLLNTFNYQSQVLFMFPPTTTTPLTTMLLQAGDYIQYEWKTNTSGQALLGSNQLFVILGGIGAPQVTSTILLQTLRGELGQWDFLKGIMTMFNLVSMVDENDPDNILIEPYSDIFITNPNSKRLDWTEKIDASEMELKPLTDLNKNTIFQFVEDEDDYAFIQYKNSTSGHLYGSKVWDASGFTILEGTKEIIAEPFAATVSKPLEGQLSQFITPAIYSMTDDGTSEGFDNSPRIFYNNGIKDTGASYYIPEQNGLLSENQTNFLQFSHLSDVPTLLSSRDFVFESQQLFNPIGVPNGSPANNLFSIYWQPYFNELYNADTRTMTLKVNLSPSDVASFKFYDTVFIKNRVFRVNKIDYKPNDLATVEFILIP